METATQTSHAPGPKARLRVCLLGATGTIGRATAAALVRHGHDVVAFVRAESGGHPGASADRARSFDGVSMRIVDVADPASLARDGFGDEPFDAVVSCMASRTGEPNDAWAIDHRAHLNVLAAAQQVGVAHFVLLSAICVQKPLLAFQHAKLAFEAALIESGLRYSIVRPTAYFKSLSGQIERVRAGRPFLIFGDGNLTACKPISDDDLGTYIAACLEDEQRWNRILPIGGPGEAITPRQQGEAPVRVAQAHAPVSLGTRRVARHDCRRPVRRWPRRPAARGEGGAGPDRTILCDRIHAGAGSRDRPLRCCCHAIDRQ